MRFEPELLLSSDGNIVKTPDDFMKRRKELLNIIDENCYGFMPEFSGDDRQKVTGTVLESITKCCSGHAVLERLEISFPVPGGVTESSRFSFRMHYFRPTAPGKHPLIVLLNFRPDEYDSYYSAEEIIDHGFALAVIPYKNVTADDADLTSGLAGCYPRREDGTDWGKLSMWAFSASRALDYLETRPEVDTKNVAVAGHSRLGKAALVAGSHDERFRFTLANCSGCGGDALEKIKHEGAENYAMIEKNFPAWFCENHRKYLTDASLMPYDHHFVAAAICPRYLATGSAKEDLWADPYSQQLCLSAASPAWEIFSQPGFIGPAPSEQAPVGTWYNEGSLSYHRRDGIHFLGRGDWLCYLDFMEKHLDK